MIKAEIFRNDNYVICGFKLSGHAGFAEEGSDIVCSAVSMLVINTINCIEEFTEEMCIRDSIYCARSYRDAPEIDGLVFVKSEEELLTGDFVNVLITASSDYDLYGDVKE